MDKRVNLRLSEKIGMLLEKQAEENGMNLSAYISHLILQVELNKEVRLMLTSLIEKLPELDFSTKGYWRLGTDEEFKDDTE